MEPEGLEPSTFCMPCRRAPNCAMAPVPQYYEPAGGQMQQVIPVTLFST